jgi:zinc/manganese transport system substrate-binding protein
MKTFWFALVISLVIFNSALSRGEFHKKLTVVATFSVLGDLIQNVGGEAIDLKVLVGADGDVHTFEPTPQDNIVLSKADVIFENGLHFEHWLGQLYAASSAHAKRIAVTDGLRLIENNQEVDPHVWHDVANAIIMVKHIEEGLSQADPTHASYFHNRTVKYIEELTGLDQWVVAQVATVPVENRKLVTSHDTFSYFCRRYGFELMGAVIESSTTEASDPSAAQIAQLVRKIRQANVKAIFTENTHSPKLLQALAQDAGVKVSTYLYTDALGKPNGEADTYIKMMQHNIRVLTEFLK